MSVNLCVNGDGRQAHGHGRCKPCYDAGRLAGILSPRRRNDPPTGPGAWAPEWTEDAACAATGNPDAWFPGEHQFALGLMAKKVCAACPVQGDCLKTALSFTVQPDGIWAGLTRKQREQMRREARRAAA